MKFLNHRIPILGFICLLFVFSCGEDEFIEPIDAELLDYFERFKTAGEERGITVDFEAAQIEGHLVDITDPGVVGKCLKYSDGRRVISVEEFSWNKYSELEKEFLIFHELGHCFLDRGHYDSSDSNGYCISIMHSSNRVCVNNYYSNTREEYLDELFR